MDRVHTDPPDAPYATTMPPSAIAGAAVSYCKKTDYDRHVAARFTPSATRWQRSSFSARCDCHFGRKMDPVENRSDHHRFGASRAGTTSSPLTTTRLIPARSPRPTASARYDSHGSHPSEASSPCSDAGPGFATCSARASELEMIGARQSPDVDRRPGLCLALWRLKKRTLVMDGPVCRCRLAPATHECGQAFGH
jgi:hypothetical protein